MAGPIPPYVPPPGAAKTTPAQVCRWALMSIGRLGATQPLEGEDLQVSFELLNGMLDAWKLNELLVEFENRATVNLTAQRNPYYIGPGGDFLVDGQPVQFPPQISFGSLVLDYQGLAIERPLGRPRTVRNVPAGLQWHAFSSDFPDRFFYLPTHHAPFGARPAGCGEIWIYPVVDNDRHLLSVWFPQMLDTFSEPLAEYYFRPGMVRALRTNLAIEMAPVFQSEPSALLRTQAKAAYDALQIIGGLPHEMEFDRALMWRRSPYNLFADDWNP